MSTDTLWYLARGSGTVALMMFTVVVVLGIATRSGRSFAGMPRLVVASVHRSASLLGVVFLTIHVTTLMFDPYAQLKLVNLIVPFTSSYRPIWVGLGALALDLVVAIVVTSLLRERIGRRAWRTVHWFAYAMWPIALIHGFGSGTDRSRIWMLGIDAVCVLAVLAVLVTAHPALSDQDQPRRPNPHRPTPVPVSAGSSAGSPAEGPVGSPAGSRSAGSRGELR
jgi:sulfoxide reductase heme-binding subunit YedZ